MTGRFCHAVEIDPAYVDVAVIRWQEFTGESARLEASGLMPDEVRAEREAGTAADTKAAGL